MSDRYEHIPISDTTRKGMTLNINDLGAISRLLTLQDDAYDEQFEKLFKLMDSQNIAIQAILENIIEIKKDIETLKKDVSRLETKVGEITTTVECTKDEVRDLSKEVLRLKKINSLWAIGARIVAGVVLAYIVIRMLHGPF